MSISRKSFSTPSSTAGLLGVGSGSSGGFKISPKIILLIAVVFIIAVYLFGLMAKSTF
ncbi:MAG: hypothetical protein WC356_05310 [Candidatus Micrarchaeia archaeon]|jgi:preprotein translocase subunit Sec61beta